MLQTFHSALLHSPFPFPPLPCRNLFCFHKGKCFLFIPILQILFLIRGLLSLSFKKKPFNKISWSEHWWHQVKASQQPEGWNIFLQWFKLLCFFNECTCLKGCCGGGLRLLAKIQIDFWEAPLSRCTVWMILYKQKRILNTNASIFGFSIGVEMGVALRTCLHHSPLLTFSDGTLALGRHPGLRTAPRP